MRISEQQPSNKMQNTFIPGHTQITSLSFLSLTTQEMNFLLDLEIFNIFQDRQKDERIEKMRMEA